MGRLTGPHWSLDLCAASFPPYSHQKLNLALCLLLKGKCNQKTLFYEALKSELKLDQRFFIAAMTQSPWKATGGVGTLGQPPPTASAPQAFHRHGCWAPAGHRFSPDHAFSPSPIFLPQPHLTGEKLLDLLRAIHWAPWIILQFPKEFRGTDHNASLKKFLGLVTEVTRFCGYGSSRYTVLLDRVSRPKTTLNSCNSHNFRSERNPIGSLVFQLNEVRPVLLENIFSIKCFRNVSFLKYVLRADAVA